MTDREPDWMGVSVYGPPDLTTKFLDLARELGFTDSPVEFCEMVHDSGAHLDFAPVPVGYPRRHAAEPNVARPIRP